MREASISRNTKETAIDVRINLDGTGNYDVETGIGFLDHMLEQLSRHSLIDLTVRAAGDLHIDFHHTTEDTGYAIGEAISQALGDRAGILHTRTVRRGGILGVGARTYVQIIAGDEADVRPARRRRAEPKASAPAAPPAASPNAGDLIRKVYAAARAPDGASSNLAARAPVEAKSTWG